MPKLTKAISDAAATSSTTLWIGTTVVFAALFFLSSVLDMKVKVSFGEPTTSSVGTTSSPTTTSQPVKSGIASQVGGC
jgi:hypothetical protein